MPLLKKNVMIYVQHLLGIGHLRRSWFFACALAERDIEVNLVSGGFPVSGLSHKKIHFHQLPPVRSLDGHFDRLVDENNQPIDDDWKQRRRDALLRLYDDINPALIVTETFPFGRRMMRFELIPLLEKARQQKNAPIIVASIRDILQPKSKPGRDQEVLDWANDYYDYIFIHGEKKLTPLSLTFPFADQLKDRLCYTGYITDQQFDRQQSDDGDEEIIVSGGGGAASLKLLKSAIAAKSFSKNSKRTWRLLVGHNLDEATFQFLKQSAPEGIIVERNRDDFSGLLARCAVSVSQAGYNTVMDILKQQCRAVLVPYAEADEVEQSLRTAQLDKMGRVVSLSEADLNAENLAKAIDKAADMPIPQIEVNLDGANRSAQLIKQLINA